MKDLYFLNKNSIQFIVAKNDTAKLSLTANEIIPIRTTMHLGNDFTISDDGKYVIVGKNISYVKISASIQFYSTGEPTSQAMLIRRERTGNRSTISTVNGYGLSVTVGKTVYTSVVEGDKIFISSSRDCVINSASTGGLRTELMIEKIA